MRLTYAMGGVFLSASGWAAIPPQHRDAVKAAVDKHCRLLSPKVRKSDIEALEFMRSQGVTAIEETAEVRASFEQIAATALKKIKGTVFSVAAWDLLQQTLQEIRGS